MRHLIRIASVALFLALIINFRWVHAASAALLAEPCDINIRTQAQARLANLFGTTLSQPIIRCVNRSTIGLVVSHGQTSFAPMLPAVVLIGPQGANIDVLAHEWVHAEISYRLGYLKRSISLPTWVDEGLAMQVDHRADYNLSALDGYLAEPKLLLPSADAISTANFYVASDQGKLHYALSRCAVAAWLVQRSNWLELLTTDLPAATRELTDNLNACS